MQILFVCTGNTCRSPLAATICQDILQKQGLNWEVKSAGLAAFNGQAASENAVEALKILTDLDLNEHRSQTITMDLCTNSDYIFTMSEHQSQILIKYLPEELKAKVHSFETWLEADNKNKEVSDPYGRGLNTYIDLTKYFLAKLPLLIAKCQAREQDKEN